MTELTEDAREVERLRSDAWKWRHLAADAAADLNRREREIARLEAQLQGAEKALREIAEAAERQVTKLDPAINSAWVAGKARDGLALSGRPPDAYR